MCVCVCVCVSVALEAAIKFLYDTSSETEGKIFLIRLRRVFFSHQLTSCSWFTEALQWKGKEKIQSGDTTTTEFRYQHSEPSLKAI